MPQTFLLVIPLPIAGGKVPCSAEFFSNIFKQFSARIKNRQRRATWKTFHRNAAQKKTKKKELVEERKLLYAKFVGL